MPLPDLPQVETFQARFFECAKKILWCISRLALPFLILYLTSSLTLKIFQEGDAWERLPYAIGAALLAFGCIYLFLRFNTKGEHSQFSLAYWGLLFVGAFCEFLEPSALLNRQATALAIVISATSVGVLIALVKYWALVAIVPFFLLLAFTAYMRIAYGIEVDAHLFSQIIGASPQDVAQFETVENVLLVVLALLAIISLAIFLVKWIGAECRLRLGVACGLLLLASCLVSHAVYFNTASYYSNAGIGWLRTICRVKQALRLAHIKNNLFVEKIAKIPSPAQQPSSLPTLNGKEGVVIVLHVGESVRADRLSINGYERNTTPWLNTCENLINFQDCTAASFQTTGSTFAILTNARGDMENDISPELQATAGCVMDLFAVNEFDCFGFFNSASKDEKNELWGAIFEREQAIYTLKAKRVYELGNSCGYMPKCQLPQIDEALQDGHENKFFLINNMGSHIPFIFYDEEHAPFLPTNRNAYYSSPQKKPEVAEMLDNAYDNTLVYTDEYIRDIVQKLEGKPFLYIYVSDHGEPLGENNKWLRANIENDYHKFRWSKVPFFFIYSPEFEQLHPHFKEALANLRNNSKMPTAHENIFHTLLGIFDIQTPYYEVEHDLSSPNPAPYQGPSCDRNGESLDGLKWE